MISPWTLPCEEHLCSFFGCPLSPGKINARRERPSLSATTTAFVSFAFVGFLEEVYATLVVRLHHTEDFKRAELWRHTAEFMTASGGMLGLRLRVAGGLGGEMEVSVGGDVPTEERIVFALYVYEHLLRHAQDVRRIRHFVCPWCHTHVGNRDVAMERLTEWLKVGPVGMAEHSWLIDSEGRGKVPSVVCAKCERRVPLWDELEERFADHVFTDTVREMDKKVQAILDAESEKLAIMGDVQAAIGLAGQVSRVFPTVDCGIDVELEARGQRGELTGRKVYLSIHVELGSEERTPSKAVRVRREHYELWKSNEYDVYIVMRRESALQWMKVIRTNGKQGGHKDLDLAFEGRAFDAMAVWRLREEMVRA